jgi:hypothetical protein
MTSSPPCGSSPERGGCHKIVHRHSQSSGGGVGPASAATNERAARKAAAAVLRQLALPAGAVRMGLGRGAPADLTEPADLMLTPHHVDTFSVWRLPESPARVISFIEAHQPRGAHVVLYTGSPPGRRGTLPTTIAQATIKISYPGNSRTVIWRIGRGAAKPARMRSP